MSGDPTLSSLIDAHGAELLRYAQHLTGDPHSAQDLVQQALLAVLVSLRKRDTTILNPQAYLITTITRAHLRRFRSGRQDELLIGDDEHGSVDRAVETDDIDARVIDRELLRRELRALDPRERIVLIQRYYLDRPDAEIAAALGVAEPTVRSIAARSLAKLRAAQQVPTPEGSS